MSFVIESRLHSSDATNRHPSYQEAASSRMLLQKQIDGAKELDGSTGATALSWWLTCVRESIGSRAGTRTAKALNLNQMR
jgi:hypothetical protein